MQTRKNITITKLDAAKRQLETVIRLYFHDGDPVSIHTLVCAAYNIIRDINKRRNGRPMFAKDEFIEFVKPEHQKEVRKKINAAENFFKHGQLGVGTLDFNPEASEWPIFEAVSYYYKLTGEDPPLFNLFRGWYVSHHESMFKLPAEQKELMVKGAEAAKSVGKIRYFEMILPVIMRQGH
jgi:hypothetical protein